MPENQAEWIEKIREKYGDPKEAMLEATVDLCLAANLYYAIGDADTGYKVWGVYLRTMRMVLDIVGQKETPSA